MTRPPDYLLAAFLVVSLVLVFRIITGQDATTTAIWGGAWVVLFVAGIWTARRDR